jgi:NADH:ubiquinone oxidoreductase subunit 6 (subunit J)
MMHLGSLASLGSLPAWLLVGVAVVAVVEIVLDVVALVDVYRRPIERVALGNKWVWVAIIVLVGLLGAILYFIVGRRPAPASPPQGAAVSADKRKSIADALYGDEGGSGQK